MRLEAFLPSVKVRDQIADGGAFRPFLKTTNSSKFGGLCPSMVFKIQLTPYLKAIARLGFASCHLLTSAVDLVIYPRHDECLQSFREIPSIRAMTILAFQPLASDWELSDLQKFDQGFPMVVAPAHVIDHAISPQLVSRRLTVELPQSFIGLVADVKASDGLIGGNRPNTLRPHCWSVPWIAAKSHCRCKRTSLLVAACGWSSWCLTLIGKVAGDG